MRPFDPTLRLARIGADDVDVERVERAAESAEIFPTRSLGKNGCCVEGLRRSSVGRCASHGLRARPPPGPGDSDISKWLNQ